MGKLYKKTKAGDREIYLGSINNQFYSRKVSDQHLYEHTTQDGQVLQGWTIDKDACDTKVFPECTFITIQKTSVEDREKSTMYIVSTADFMQFSIELRDRYFLALEYWDVEESKETFKRIPVVEK